MKIEVADGIISATVTGAGHPVVLLHSLLADRGSFDRIAAQLAEQHQVIIPDLPGFGDSTPVAGGLAEIADQVAAAVRTLLGDERPIVLGNGFGGFIALHMALRHKALISRLIIADSGAAFSEPGRQAFRTMASVAAAKGLEAIADTAMLRLFAPAFQAANPGLMAERRAAFLRTDPAAFQTACSALAALDIRDAVRSVTVPALVLVGEHDEATPPAMSAELAGLLPDARLVILPDCAHVPQLQRPDAFLAAVNPFIAEGKMAAAQA